VQKKFSDWKAGRLKVIAGVKNQNLDFTAFKQAKIQLERKGGKDAILAQLRMLPQAQWGELKEWYCRTYPEASAAQNFNAALDERYAEIDEKKTKLSAITANIGGTDAR
jgi:phage terminase large subunit-like protein